ncbi:hypothetical protein QR680_003493 [Steinernema hermaphroditum]|uniref:Uncharacterized protein n=1 Tax=Steinernema hermaphroditum TaxID=289476 RepID=A0AA39HKL6_9BILA|nr:hypothetical protein QR680_003493 [Steinernema hermaphroditum]
MRLNIVALFFIIAFTYSMCAESENSENLTNEAVIQKSNLDEADSSLINLSTDGPLEGNENDGLPENNSFGIRAKRDCCGYGGCCGYCRLMTIPTPDPKATMKPCYGCCCGCGGYGY